MSCVSTEERMEQKSRLCQQEWAFKNPKVFFLFRLDIDSGDPAFSLVYRLRGFYNVLLFYVEIQT